MNRNHYDEQRAGELVPLLRAITVEIQERSDAIARLESEIERLNGQKGRAKNREAQIRRLQPTLSIHRRELRSAVREIERLGCVLDADHPLRVLIPGRNGELEHGFAWSPLDESMQGTSS